MMYKHKQLFEERFPFISIQHFNELMDKLTEPHRHLHSYDFHIAPMIERIMKIEDITEQDRDRLLLLAFYHDSIYIPGNPFNENMSMSLFFDHTQGNYENLTSNQEELVGHVGSDIISTKDHKLRNFDPIWNMFVELDYGPLMNKNWPDYGSFSSTIESEMMFYMEFMDTASFNEVKYGRIKFLSDMMCREPDFVNMVSEGYISSAINLWNNFKEEDMPELIKSINSAKEL